MTPCTAVAGLHWTRKRVVQHYFCNITLMDRWHVVLLKPCAVLLHAWDKNFQNEPFEVWSLDVYVEPQKFPYETTITSCINCQTNMKGLLRIPVTTGSSQFTMVPHSISPPWSINLTNCLTVQRLLRYQGGIWGSTIMCLLMVYEYMPLDTISCLCKPS